jgi:glycosyltransferase involved in cell wall biosynthesis
MKVSIVIPVYNEFRTFNQVMERVRRAPLPAGCSKEIIVIDDGSTDGTAQMLGPERHVISHSGKGSAIRAGIQLATGDIVLIQDGDLEYDPEDYARLLEPIVAGQADIVYGSRFLCQSIGKSMGPGLEMAWQNRVANRILTAVANLLYSAQLTDEATAYKAFRAAVLNRIHFQCRRFEFCPEVTAKARRLGYRIHEVPVSYNARGIAEGKKIRARDGWEALWTLLRYRFTPRARL